MKKCMYILLPMVLLLSMMIPAFANSAEPPGIIVISHNTPEDARLSLVTDSGEEWEFRQVIKSQKAWESQYRLWFPLELRTFEDTKLCVSAGAARFVCDFPEDSFRFRTVLTLDFEAKTLTSGQDPWRQPVLIAIRLTLTLLLEALVFLAFGFRKKRSWILFLSMNLMTQICLNLIISSNAFSGGYWMIVYYLAEFIIFQAEAAVACLLIREKKWWQRILSTLLANLVSLIAGVVLISNLPI